jgi:hypothetical protein
MKYFTNLVLLITLIIFGTYIRADSQSSCALNQVSMTALTVTGPTILNNVNGIVNAATMTGADIGAKINAAMTSLPNGGTVYIPAGTYNFATTIQCPITGAGSNAFIITGAGSSMAADHGPNANTWLNYTGSGDAINQVVTVFANQNQSGCQLRDFTLDGGAATGSPVGFHFGGVEHASTWNVTISRFAGIGIEIENGPTNEWTERYDLQGFLWSNTIGIKFLVDTGGNPSFEHGYIKEWFNTPNNGSAIQITGNAPTGDTAQLSGTSVIINGNIGTGSGTTATVWTLTNGAYVQACDIFEGEECDSTSCVSTNLASGTQFNSPVRYARAGGPWTSVGAGNLAVTPPMSEHLISAQIPDSILGNQFHVFPIYPVAPFGSVTGAGPTQFRMFCGFPNTCTTYPTFQLYDVTASAYVASASIVCAAGTTANNTNSYPLVAGHSYTVNDTVAPAGCTANNFFTVAVDQLW